MKKNPRLFRFTPGTVSPLESNTKHTFAQRHALAHFESNSIFTFIPKNACTSLRLNLAIANGFIENPRDWVWVHKNSYTLSAPLSSIVTAKNTSVILRCPLSRLASTFLDKIVSRSFEFWKLFRASKDTIDPDKFTFREFVDWISKPDILRDDIHWRPQVDFLVYENYDGVFGLHQMQNFAKFYDDVTKGNFIDSRPFSNHSTSTFHPLTAASYADTPMVEIASGKAKGVLPRHEHLYDDDLIEKVSFVFQEDLELYRAHLGREGLLFG